jgi:hypothetical protein
MSTKMCCLVGVMFLAFSLPLPAQAPGCIGQSALVYADTASFLLDAPPGWILDCNAGKDQGPLTVLYRVGESWRTGQAVMYATVLRDPARTMVSFSKRVDAEVAEWRRGVPDARVVALAPIPTKGGARASVRRFQSPAKQLFEVVAYIPRGHIMPLLTMTARTDTAFKHALPAFNRLVQSYAPGPVVKAP